MSKTLTNQEILTKAIEKAIANGWKVTIPTIDGMEFTPQEWYSTHIHVNVWIFNHSFAKALWGEEPINDRDNIDVSDYQDGITNNYSWTNKDESSAILDGDYSYRELPAWQYHLQQMVIAEDPIAYLGENI